MQVQMILWRLRGGRVWLHCSEEASRRRWVGRRQAASSCVQPSQRPEAAPGWEEGSAPPAGCCERAAGSWRTFTFGGYGGRRSASVSACVSHPALCLHSPLGSERPCLPSGRTQPSSLLAVFSSTRSGSWYFPLLLPAFASKTIEANTLTASPTNFPLKKPGTKLALEGVQWSFHT